MIHFVNGNILESDAEALINTVNLVGVMGKGIALQFKNAFPDNFAAYKKACTTKEIAIGHLLVFESLTSERKKLIINFPTKTDWWKSSEYEYIAKGLADLLRIIDKYDIKSIAIPPLGAGNGGLDWNKVKSMIIETLNDSEAEVFVYEPNSFITEKMKSEKVKLTPARALLLYILYRLVADGEFVSEFSCVKICYFLQKFGAEKYFKLVFKPYFYGPYSYKVRFVMRYLNGSYISGFSDMDKKPFEPVSLIADNEDEIDNYIEKDPELKQIADKTERFLSGFYSNFSLELLSTIDYIMENNNSINIDEINQQLNSWSPRKSRMFSDISLIKLARNHIIDFN